MNIRVQKFKIASDARLRGSTQFGLVMIDRIPKIRSPKKRAKIAVFQLQFVRGLDGRGIQIIVVVIEVAIVFVHRARSAAVGDADQGRIAFLHAPGGADGERGIETARQFAIAKLECRCRMHTGNQSQSQQASIHKSIIGATA